MKKFLCLSLVLAIFINVGSFALASDISDKQKATNFLLNSGWTQEDIDDLLTDEALLVYADAISSSVSEKKYYRVTEDEVIEISKNECNAGVTEAKSIINKNHKLLTNQPSVNTVSPTVTTYDGYMESYVQVVHLGGKKYAIGSRFEWLIEPTQRRIDVFGVGHDGSVVKNNDPVYFIYKADKKKINRQTEAISSAGTSSTQSPASMCPDSGGVGVGIDLYDSYSDANYAYYYENSRGYLQYNILLNDSSCSYFYVYSKYMHQQKLWSVTPTISFPLSGGLSVSSSNHFKLMTPNPDLTYAV